MTPAIPTVCLMADLCRLLRMSLTTLKRHRRHRTFPIPELPALDKHPRWSGAAVQQFLEGQSPAVLRRPWKRSA